MLTNPRRPSRLSAGFTLIEVLAVLALVGILAAIAYPSYAQQIRQSRRIDGHAALINLQWAQERWRSQNPGYASMAELGVASTSEQSHYALQVTAAGDDGYELLAIARGAQALDENCRFLKMSVTGGSVSKKSGSNENTTNSAADNRRCWPR